MNLGVGVVISSSISIYEGNLVIFTKILNGCCGAGEMAQRLRALPVLPKVLSSIPSNHMVAHNHL